MGEPAGGAAGGRRRGLLFVLSAPSGAGKTTICREILDFFKDIRQSVSYTTRPPRPGERDGRDYHFVSPERFQQMIDAGAFAEWAEIYGHRYGTALADLERLRAEGYDVILDVDTQGAANLRRRFGEGVYIFVLPPSLEALAERLRARGSESGPALAERLAKARTVIPEAVRYDYLIVNEDFAQAVTELRSIIIAERCRREHRLPELMPRYPVDWSRAIHGER